MRLISGPAIAALHHRTRKWAFQHLKRGTFGETFVCAGIVYAELAAVERAAGEAFSAAQLCMAVDGKSGRLIVLPEREVD